MKLNPWPWLALFLVISGLFGIHFYFQNNAVKEAIVLTTQNMNKEYQAKLDASKELAKDVTTKLENDAKASIINKDAEIKNLNTSLSNALNSLRNRPKRESSKNNTNPPENRSSCTGAELYREDGEFLTREASRAQSLILDRDFYYNQYENARTALEKLSNETTNP